MSHHIFSFHHTRRTANAVNSGCHGMDQLKYVVPVLLVSVFYVFGLASDVQVLCEFLMDRFPGCFGFFGKHFVTDGGLPCLFPLRIEEMA